MLKYDLHKKLQNFNRKLNTIYKENAPLYQIEDSWQGFEWISADEKENNTFSFKRIDRDGNEVIGIFNFSGKDFPVYRLGVNEGEYKLLISSDEVRFGGTGVVKKKTYKTRKKYAHGKDRSILIKLPKLSGSYFVKIR